MLGWAPRAGALRGVIGCASAAPANTSAALSAAAAAVILNISSP
jgi:hypothetical protein